MSVEENLQKVDASIEAFNDHDLDRFVGLRAESIVHHDPALPEPLKGRAALREFVQGYVNAFPDIRIEKERTFGQGDWVSVVGTITGTHKGPLAGPGGQSIPATNRSASVNFCSVLKFEGGQIVEESPYYDQLGFMAQLGLAP